MNASTPGPLEQGPLLQDLAGRLVSAVPEGWQQLTYLTRVIGAHTDETLAVQDTDGQVSQVEVPEGVGELVGALKRAGYQEGRGTWLSMIVSVHHTHQLNVEYNHDTEPELAPGAAPLAYAQELERFPRDEEAVPAWLRARLAEARELPTEQITADFGAALVEACAAEGLRAEYLPPTGLRVSLPDGGVLMDNDLKDTFDQAAVLPPEQRLGLATHFGGYMARAAGERGAPGGAPAADSGADDAVANALVAAFREEGVEVSFEEADTLVVPLPDGNRATTDISGFRSALADAAPDQLAHHAAGFARAAVDQLAKATRPDGATGAPAPDGDPGADGAGRLRVRLYPASAFPEGILEELLAREIAPGLWQTVVVDSPQSLQPLSRKAHEDTGRPDDEVFAEAVAGSLDEPVEVSEHDLDGVRLVHIGGPHPYVAAQAHALGRHIGEAPHGALVAFPVPEVLIAHPLGQGHPLAAMENLQEIAGKFAADAAKPIGAQLYWWHPGSLAAGQEAVPDLRAVGIEVDHEAKSVSVRTSDEEFGPVLDSLLG
ncbi:hypothetical protein OUQ99_10955 [Streptomonospora nanhaiensis]|uniref:Uncharacterized protein n=1 Tax=Streptomonospora nanhaiensis TaxID=1323731 RepID=A0ABY6YUM3_9ACTN|nr:hypothetical protein [Streptomonospora nanhaiensis]WAE75560.1 hypothetical protein OUQ99_10955 [Streptomonospora nanhaiensis]